MRTLPSRGIPYLPFLILFILAASPSMAQETASLPNSSAPESFSADRFAALQATDEVILVEISASWCPTCAKQKEILQAYREANPETALRTLVVDFDSQKEWVRAFKAPRQSTLILYRGEEQVWFSVAETNRERILAAINDALTDG